MGVCECVVFIRYELLVMIYMCWCICRSGVGVVEVVVEGVVEGVVEYWVCDLGCMWDMGVVGVCECV